MPFDPVLKHYFCLFYFFTAYLSLLPLTTMLRSIDFFTQFESGRQRQLKTK